MVAITAISITKRQLPETIRQKKTLLKSDNKHEVSAQAQIKTAAGPDTGASLKPYAELPSDFSAIYAQLYLRFLKVSHIYAQYC